MLTVTGSLSRLTVLRQHLAQATASNGVRYSARMRVDGLSSPMGPRRIARPTTRPHPNLLGRSHRRSGRRSTAGRTRSQLGAGAAAHRRRVLPVPAAEQEQPGQTSRSNSVAPLLDADPPPFGWPVLGSHRQRVIMPK